MPLSIVVDLKQFIERFSAYTHPNLHRFNVLWGIMIDTLISVIVVSPITTWEAHHNDLDLGINSYNTSPENSTTTPQTHTYTQDAYDSHYHFLLWFANSLFYLCFQVCFTGSRKTITQWPLYKWSLQWYMWLSCVAGTPVGASYITTTATAKPSSYFMRRNLFTNPNLLEE